MRDFAWRIAVSALLIITACSYTPPDGDDVPTDGAQLPVVQFDVASSTVDENVTDHKIVVKLSEPSTSSVDFKVTGGIAIQNTDYAFINGSTTGTLTFAGDTKDIELMISSDGLEEPDEDIEITLDNPQGATLGDKIKHTVLISANILPRVKFTSTATSRNEDTAGAKLDLELDVEPTAPVSIDVVFTGGATAVDDYTLANQTVTFQTGIKTAELDYGVVADTRDENNEIIAVDLANPSNVVIDTSASHTEHTILDDDATPTVFFETAAVTQDEGVANASQKVKLSAASNLPITVDVVQTGTAAATADVVVGVTSVSFAAGETEKTVPITIQEDVIDEASETVILTLANPSNAAIAAPAAHTLTITDNDASPTVTFAAAATNATEGDPALTIAVNLTGNATEQVVTVDFARNASSTAALTTDFTFGNLTQTLSFAPGVTTQNITVNLVDDDAGELDETLILNLSNFTNSTAGTITAHTVNITDDDCLGSGNFRVCLPAAPAGAVTLTGTLNTDNNANCANAQPLGWTTTLGQQAACFVIADTISVGAAGVTVVGSRPLVLVGGTSITVVGVIDASATGTSDGPGGASSLCKPPVSAAESSNDGGGGGAGGSFMSKGGNGGNGNNDATNADGGVSAAVDAADPTILRGGCRGANGGSGPGEAGTGGGAGGALYLVAPTITIGAKLDVSGSGGLGGGFDAGGAGGGGTGGMLFIDALTTLTQTGPILANGGGGGEGADNNTSGEAGGDPVTFNVNATGGDSGGNSAGGNGGRGARTGAGANNGLKGDGNEGAGGGGGGGGFVKSTKALGANVSAGKIVQ